MAQQHRPTRGTRSRSRTKKRGRVKEEQLRLDRNWHGGWRPRSGRPKVTRSRVAHRTREAFDHRHVLHVTMKLEEGLGSLRQGPEFQRVWESLIAGCQRDGFRIVHASVQGDHLHLLCEGDGTEPFGRWMNGLATRIARGLNRLWQRRGRVFRERYHSRVLRSPRAVRNALAYVFGNAEHHGRRLRIGHVDSCSSAPWFHGWRNSPINQRPPLETPLARARTWMLRSGWLRWGLLSLDDGPPCRAIVACK